MIRSKAFLIAASAGIFTITACTDIYTQNGDANQRTKEGAGVGAAFGALAGVVTGNSASERARNAVIGGLVGGAVGGALGNSLDKQAADLEAAFANNNIQIINSGDKLTVRMPQDLLFAVDSASLRGDLQNDLAALASNLQQYSNSTVTITGHTDNTGAADYNQNLSERRAGAVANVLIGRGVSIGRVQSVGAGEDRPIASNLTDEGRAQNRRVDIVITPTKG